MRKMMKNLCMLLMLVAVCWFVGTGKSQVMAANNEFDSKEFTGIPTETPKSDKEGYIFAGYYKENTCETPVTTAGADETVYAKFVPSKVLSVKAQLKADTTASSANTNLRLVSTVDSLNYKAVGFEVYYNGAEKPIVIKSTTVYKRIVASAESGVDYNYGSKVIDTESEYFITATLVNINKNNFDKGFYIKPYWKTLDGTTVYGEGKYITVNNGLDKNNINLAVNVGENFDVSKATVSIPGVTSKDAKVEKYDAPYAYINVTVENKNTNLPSLSEVVVSDGTISKTTTYRNLVKEYNGTPDTSWYTVDSDASAFTIVTAADLYGFATVVNEQAVSFEGKTIYVVADIAVNEGNANVWKTAAPQDIKKWTPIGKTNRFKGTFDGGMHTISGLYSKETTANTGFFGGIESATIKNLQLMNSCFVSTSTDSGSITGVAPGGTIENIYSDAVVVSSNKRVGGLVGQTSKVTTIQNCWFDGSVESTYGSTDVLVGGLVGLVQSEGTQCQILNCMNSGTVSATATSDMAPEVGGLLGGKYTNKAASVLTVKNCFNIGTVNGPSGVTGDFGAFVGYNANGTFENVYATTESCSNTKTKPTGTQTVDVANVLGGKASEALLGFDFASEWATVTGYTPVLASFKSITVDDSWYDEAKDTYVLKDKADLLGFAAISQENNFEGKTVKLGSNIKVNAGSAADWATTAPMAMWMPIGNANVPFAGTFDGGLYTISGIYLKTATQGGLFSQTATTATVKNLYLENSYFESSGADFGSIAGIAAGTFTNIYSNATVKGTSTAQQRKIGGLVGNAYAGFRLFNSWFDGSVTSASTKAARVGGLIGVVSQNGEYLVYNCLNTGDVNLPGATATFIESGGLVGIAPTGTHLTLVNSLNTGAVSYGNANDDVEALVGYSKTGTLTIINSYATEESCDRDLRYGGKKVAESAIQGDLASDVLSGFNFEGVWKEVADNTPVLNLTAAQDYDATWFDATATEYVLNDKADLYAFAEMSQVMNFAGKTVKLGADIVVNTGDASTWGTTAPEYAWTPIGSYANRFAGTFDGDNHTISGLYLLTGYRRQGLFSATAAGSTVKNLRLTNSYFKSTVTGGQSEFGSIVGDAIGTFSNIYSNAIIVGSGIQNGGILGYVTGDSIIDNVWFDGSITNSRTTDLRIGGIVGNVAKDVTADFTNCLNTGAISGPNATGNDVCIGGIVGWVGTSATMTNCLALGPVTALNGGNNIGSVAGHDAGEVITVTNVYGTAASHKWKGVTKAYRIENNNYTTLLGETATGTLTGFDFENTWAVVEGNTPVLKSFYDIMVDTSWYDENEDTFVLYDKADLYGFTMLSKENNFEGKTIKLGADIVVNAGAPSTWNAYQKMRWLPIGEFAGTFDGANHTISGIFFNGSQANAGLFSKTTKDAVLENFKLENSYIKNADKAYTGSIVGYGNGTIHNVHSSAEVYSNNKYVGGLVGGNYGGDAGFTMTQCSFGGTAEGSFGGDIELGGLVGYLASPNCIISNCLNTGTINGTNTKSEDIGGLIGCAAGDCGAGARIENLLNIGTVTNTKSSPSYTDPAIGYKNSKVTGVTNVYATSATKTGKEVQLENIKGEAARQTLVGFDFYNVWKTRVDNTPVLGAETTTADEFVVKGAADLVAISNMSYTDNFEGKTIKLAADIDLKDISWTPISNQKKTNGDPALSFAGTFDGQGYTISNLSVTNTAGYAGLFASTNSKAVIKNLIIDTATISSTNKYVGVIAGQGQGTYSDIRVTNATVAAKGRMAGLIGLAEGSVTMSNCSFEGTVTCSGTDKENRYVGGLIGYISSGNLKMSNCLNLGDVYDSAECTSDKPGVGGIIGCISASVKTIEIHSCVNAGTVTVRSTSAVSDFGPFIGRLNLPTNGFELYELTKNYTVPCTDTSIVEDIQVVETATDETMPLLDWENHWEMVEGVPQVRFAKSDFVEEESIEVDATALTNLTTLYSNRNLKQGDIHAHANNGGASDGTASLAEWKTQMVELDMDFAASLDHRETDHIRLNDWDKDKFIYGTELGAGIHDSATKVNGQDLGIHYNMMFSKEEDFVNLLTKTEFSDDFDYSEEAIDDRDWLVGGNKYKGGHIKEAGFDTTAELKRFIQAVQTYNGFYVLAHPMNSPSYITADNWKTYLKPYAVDGMGIEVMYDALTGSQCKKGYELWKAMLNDGYKVYATAGTDTHKALETQHPSGPWEALTSIYAAKENGENYWSEAYLRYLRGGNFTAGSVGIQMCVGSTQMGGTGTFSGEYLEVGVGALHKSVYNAEHKYRVEIWSNEGLVYTQQFDATTDESQMTYLRMKADADSKYYRVEIYDTTTNLRIALGNPIWNEK